MEIFEIPRAIMDRFGKDLHAIDARQRTVRRKDHRLIKREDLCAFASTKTKLQPVLLYLSENDEWGDINFAELTLWEYESDTIKDTGFPLLTITARKSHKNTEHNTELVIAPRIRYHTHKEHPFDNQKVELVANIMLYATQLMHK